MAGAICDELLLKVLPIKQQLANTGDVRRNELLLRAKVVYYLYSRDRNDVHEINIFNR